MFDTTIAGKCCSQLFIATTEDAPKVGALIPCKHCGEIIELAHDNMIISATTQAEWDEFETWNAANGD